MTSESKKEKLNKNELLANYQYLMDTIWTIYLEDGSVDILKYSMNPELVNTKQDYTSLANILRNDIYSPDRSLWDETVSIICAFLKSLILRLDKRILSGIPSLLTRISIKVSCHSKPK